MDRNYWLKRWSDNETGFHNDKPHPLLVKHFKSLEIKKGTTVLVPLCGKSLDLVWIASQGHRTVGVEFSQTAAEQFFDKLKVRPDVSRTDGLQKYQSENLEIFVGDFFDTSSKHFGEISAVYDRAALVALPLDLRQRYTTHIKDITHKASQLLICYKYNQELMKGPPFIVSLEEVKNHYEKSHKVSHLDTAPSNQLKGEVFAEETIYLLKKREV